MHGLCSRPKPKKLRWLNYFQLFAVLLLCTSCGGPLSFYFKKLEIDRAWHLIPRDFVSVTEPHSDSYYFMMHAGSGLDTVIHFKTIPERHDREILLWLETDKAKILDEMVKSEEILHGPFGTIYADKTCWYSRPLESNTNSVAVHYKQNHGGEIPRQLLAEPPALPPLTSISLIRVFRDQPEYLVASGNYEPDGKLGSLDVGRGKNGSWTQGGFSVQTGSGSPFAARHGIPFHIDLQQYLQLHRLPLPLVTMPQVLTILNQHYGHNQIIRQDTLENGSIVSTRYLQPSVTEEELVLKPECEARFQTQVARGMPTVW